MSAEIKMPAVTTPPIVIKVGGKCYSLKGEAVPGKPDNSLSNIQWSGITCVACQAAGNVPNTCPTGLDSSYILNVSTPFIECAHSYAFSGPVWDGVCFGLNSCVWGISSPNPGVQIPTTSDTLFYGLGGINLGNSVEIGLVASTYWYAMVRTGGCYGVWTMSNGATPVGPYSLVDFGTAVRGYTCTWRQPSSITVSAVA